MAHKQRKLEFRAGMPAVRGHISQTASYSLKAVRAAEWDLARQAEIAYRDVIWPNSEERVSI